SSHAARRSFRILHAPVNVGDHAWLVSRAERALGVDSDLVTTVADAFFPHFDRLLHRPGDRGLVNLLRQAASGYSAALRYDALHLYFGRSLLDFGGGRRPAF